MAIRKSSNSGIPFGNTASRPASPVVGQPYYNGQIEALEIYNGTSWKVAKTEGFPPDAPTISSVTDSSTALAYSSTAGTLDVVFIPAGTGGTVSQYNAYTTVGGHSSFTTIGNTVTITGLTPGTAYTVYGNAQNGSGVSTNTANAAAVTPTTLPQTPTIGTTTLSGGLPVVNWTLGSAGGKNLSAITITPYLNGTTAETSRTAATTSSTSYTFTSGQLTEDASYTFKVKTTNANGQSTESSASNSVTVNEIISIDYLVIAGGGAGNYSPGNGGTGGGGAGGLRSTVTATGGGGTLENALALTPGTTYTIEVGGGGVAVQGSTLYPGTNSSFSSVTSTGGGGGGVGQGSGGGGGTGGSGGGAGENASGYYGIRTASPVQGFNGGGTIYTGSNGHGGGGAGAVGGDADNNTQAGNGGNGVAVSITGSSVTYAGGGGGSSYTGNGGSGGTGGGGNGTGPSNRSSATAGATNTGSGGGSIGGSRGYGGSANGGSGVVILRSLSSAASTTGSPVATTSGSYYIYKFNNTGSITF
jgi:mucin-19